MYQPPVDVLRAADVARSHHRWQSDEAGRPYFDAHVADVHRRVSGRSTAVQAVALLHDVLVGTSCTEEELRREFPGHVVDAVLALTQQSGEPFEQYCERVRADPLALEVALADLASRTAPGRLAGLDEPTRERLAAEYRQARAALTGRAAP